MSRRALKSQSDPDFPNLCGQYLRRTAERGGHSWEARCGIALGCPLRPVMGALLLADLEATLAQHGFLVVRYMDDILVRTPTRWKLRAAVRLVHQGLAALGLRTHPAKTCIGQIARGLTFLGDEIRPQRITVAPQTAERCIARARQLYEQRPGGAAGAARLGAYVRRWGQWVWAGMPSRGLAGVGEALARAADRSVGTVGRALQQIIYDLFPVCFGVN